MVEVHGILVSSRISWVAGKSRCCLEPLRSRGLKPKLFSWYTVWGLWEGNSEMWMRHPGRPGLGQHPSVFPWGSWPSRGPGCKFYLTRTLPTGLEMLQHVWSQPLTKDDLAAAASMQFYPTAQPCQSGWAGLSTPGFVRRPLTIGWLF